MRTVWWCALIHGKEPAFYPTLLLPHSANVNTRKKDKQHASIIFKTISFLF
jgi:hypothetical protein